MADFYWLVLSGLVVWRITHLLNTEDGPLDIIVRFRRVVGEGFWGKLLDCFYCLSLWIAAPVAWFIGTGWKQRLFLWPALSAVAILFEHLTKRNISASPAIYYEDKETDHGVLRESAEAAQHFNSKPSDTKSDG